MRGHGEIAYFLGTVPKAPEEIALTIAGTHFLDRIQRFSQRLGKPRRAVVFKLFKVFDPFTQLHRGVDH